MLHITFFKVHTGISHSNMHDCFLTHLWGERNRNRDEIERQRKTETQTDRKRHRETPTDTHTHRQRQWQRDRTRDRDTKTDTHTHTQLSFSNPCTLSSMTKDKERNSSAGEMHEHYYICASLPRGRWVKTFRSENQTWGSKKEVIADPLSKLDEDKKCNTKHKTVKAHEVKPNRH